MSSSDTSPESWIGKLVWVFLRDDAGLSISNKAECGIVVDCDHNSIDWVYVVQVDDNYYRVWSGDMEEVEDWSEEMEGEDGSMEESRKGPRKHDRYSSE